MVFSRPLTITFHYSDEDTSGVSEASLTLYAWSGDSWSPANASLIERDLVNNRLVITIDQAGTFALFRRVDQPWVYLPLVVKQ